MYSGTGSKILNFQNTFDSACDEIRLEIPSRKFLLNPNLNEIVVEITGNQFQVIHYSVTNLFELIIFLLKETHLYWSVSRSRQLSHLVRAHMNFRPIYSPSLKDTYQSFVEFFFQFHCEISIKSCCNGV